MNTLSNMANSASKAIWGEQEGHQKTDNETAGQEPISGEQGAGTTNEPFDKGNEVPTTGSEPKAEESIPPKELDSSTKTEGPIPPTEQDSSTKAEGPAPPTTEPDSTTKAAGPAPPKELGSKSKTEGPAPPTTEPDSTTKTESPAPPTTEPDSTTKTESSAPPTTEPDSTTKTESPAPATTEPDSTTKTESPAPATTEPDSTNKTDNDTVPAKEQASTSKPSVERNADPNAKSNVGSASIESHMPKNDQEREELAAKGALPHDPNDHSGEPLHMHDASEKENENEEGGKVDRSASVAQEGGGEHGKVKGTGEQYVKASGVAAEGGDFDATKPGAGAEANRLLEQHGVHREKPGESANESTDDVASKDSETIKTSKMTKLKEKLHIGHKKP